MDYKKFEKKSGGPVKIAESLSKLGVGQHTIVFKVKINSKEVSQEDFRIEGEDFSKLLSREYWGVGFRKHVSTVSEIPFQFFARR